MKVGFFQFNPLFGEKEKNLETIKEALIKNEFDLIVLPELATTGYLFVEKEELERLGEPVPQGPTSELMLELADLKNAVIIIGLLEKSGKKFFNSAVAYLPGRKFFVYRKTHLFFEEKKFFEKGDTGFFVFNFKEAKIGIMICFDWFFYESSRTLALKGADIIAHPANLVLPWGQVGMQYQALQNRVFVITANRTGREKRGNREFRYTGKSQIVAPDGQILAKADENETVLKIVEIEPERARDKKLNEFNDIFKDRRPEFYRIK